MTNMLERNEQGICGKPKFFRTDVLQLNNYKDKYYFVCPEIVERSVLQRLFEVI